MKPVTLPSELEQFISDEVSRGDFTSREEVIAEAVRQMQAQQELRAEIQLGIDSLDRGEGIILNGDDELRGHLEKIKEDGRTQLAANETGPAE